MRLFNVDGIFYRTLERIGDLLIVNILFLICSLPIITIGASTTAMYAVLIKLVQNGSGYIVKDFFEEFKSNFKQATIIWGIALTIGISIYLNLFYFRILAGNIPMILRVILIIAIFIYSCVLVYVFAVQSKFENSVIKTLRTSAFMAIGYLPLTIVLVALNVLPFVVVFIKPELFWRIIPVAIILGFSGIGYICSMIFSYIFGKHTPKLRD